MSEITSKTWNYTYYTAKKLKAFISIGGEPSDNLENHSLVYFLTITNLEDQEILQQKYMTLNEAINSINTRYSEWKLVEKSIKDPDASGCSSCNAH